MPSQTERIKSAIQLTKSGDIPQEDCINIIDRILTEKPASNRKPATYPATYNRPLVIKGSRKYTQWTKRETEELKRLITKGKSYKHIANKLKRTYDAVRIRSERLGFGIYTEKNGRRLISLNNLKGRKWTPIEDKTIIDMLADGKKFDDIANVLKRSLKAVLDRYYSKFYKKQKKWR